MAKPISDLDRQKANRLLYKAITHNLLEVTNEQYRESIADLCIKNQKLFLSQYNRQITLSFVYEGEYYFAYNHDPRKKTIGGVEYKHLNTLLDPSLIPEFEEIHRNSFQSIAINTEIKQYVAYCIQFMTHLKQLPLLKIPINAMPDWIYKDEAKEIFNRGPDRTAEEIDDFIAEHHNGYKAIKRIFLYNIVTSKTI